MNVIINNAQINIKTLSKAQRKKDWLEICTNHPYYSKKQQIIPVYNIMALPLLCSVCPSMIPLSPASHLYDVCVNFVSLLRAQNWFLLFLYFKLYIHKCAQGGDGELSYAPISYSKFIKTNWHHQILGFTSSLKSLPCTCMSCTVKI